MNVSMDLDSGSLLEGCQKRTMLSINDVKTDLDHLHIQHSIGHTDLRLDLIKLHNNRMLSCIWINTLEYGLFFLSLLFL